MYSWLDENEVESSIFKNFNKRFSVYREGEYRGVVWEYPWLSMLLNYEVMDNILILGSKRLYQIFKGQHPTRNVYYETQLSEVFEKIQFDAIICEDLCGSLERLSISIKDLIYLLKPLGKFVITYRYSFETAKIDVMNELFETKIRPYSYQECDILPCDAKFESLSEKYREKTEQSKLLNGKVTSIGLALYKPFECEELKHRKMSFNELWLSENQIIEYMDMKEKVDNINLSLEHLYRVFYMPKELLQLKLFTFEDFCNYYGVIEEVGCQLINEFLIKALII